MAHRFHIARTDDGVLFEGFFGSVVADISPARLTIHAEREPHPADWAMACAILAHEGITELGMPGYLDGLDIWEIGCRETGGTMEHRTWIVNDPETRKKWGEGPWQDEPDKEQWQDEATGCACLLKRNQMGALCGYVGVPEGHPWHGEGYDGPAANVHGGLTYAGLCQDGPEESTICHVPGPGEQEPLWWLGFDCSHSTDFVPGVGAEFDNMGRDYPGAGIGLPWGEPTYKDIGFVKAECARLAAQAAVAEVKHLMLKRT